MNEKTTAFLADIKVVCEKHSVTVTSHEEWGGQDSDGDSIFTGTGYEFTGGVEDGSEEWIYVSMQDIEEVLNT